VMGEEADLDYVVRVEGTDVWIDNLAIPKDAPHPENAHAFLNHIHDAQVNAEIADTIRYATANLAARSLIHQDDLKNPRIYPPAKVVARARTLVVLVPT